ncbi:hypothetical protein COO91_10997 (plasmid) [Nostoc flagelliforme CCNUN1]|uniref:Coenzyme Q-binding protein COQ10 START domain-containing protein n=1 Tax=Nostoc flagelliforme CCNUN1 TaxID=2038116 RepID=A0A2K8TAN5_9NOSO|nr:hypothetical protein [Nostoc flagelliforme]AUB44754.1 hypothetical protein COO91_10997 [Nostoc flagelliforme CCNUN1]
MLICANSQIPFPRSLVYATYRDKLVELVPYMPNVRDIEVKSRSEVGSNIYTVNEWRGGSEIPAAARVLLSEDMLSWTEYNTWNQADLTVEWRIETHAFTEAVKCSGKNRFLQDGNSTVIESRGELVIDPKQIKGVPFFLRSKIAHLVEDLLGKNIQPNLVAMSAGVRQYLEQNQLD